MNYFKKISFACALSLSSSAFAVTPSNTGYSTQTDTSQMSREEIISQAIPTASLGIRLGQCPTPRRDAIVPSFTPLSHQQKRLGQRIVTIVQQHRPEERPSLIQALKEFTEAHQHLQLTERLIKTIQHFQNQQRDAAIQPRATPIPTLTPIQPQATDQKPVCWRIDPKNNKHMLLLNKNNKIVATKSVRTKTRTGLRTMTPSGRVKIYLQNGKSVCLPRYSGDDADLIASGFAPSDVSPAVYVYIKSNAEIDLDNAIEQIRPNMEEDHTAAEILMDLNQNSQEHAAVLREKDIAFLTEDMDTSSDDLFESEPGQDRVIDLTSDVDMNMDIDSEHESDTDDELRICDESDDE